MLCRAFLLTVLAFFPLTSVSSFFLYSISEHLLCLKVNWAGLEPDLGIAAETTS